MIIRNKKQKNYTIVFNDVLNNSKMSLKAKGLLVFMLSKPDVWDFSINGLKSQLKEGRDSLSNGLKELEDNKYLKRVKIRNEKGRFLTYEYELYEKPFSEEPNTDIPITDFPTSVNQQQVSTNTSNNYLEESTKQELNYIPKNQKNDFSDIVVKDFEIIKPNQTSIITQIEEKEKSSAQKEKEYDYAVKTCFDVCLHYFPKHLHPKNKNNWLDVIEKLNRIDNIPFETITSITQWARNDNFWKSNFLSLTKLRKNNRDGIKYIIAFNEKMKNEQNNRNNTNKDHVSRMQNANSLVDNFFGKQ